jgi:response regulator RpfG family c-di-GMP phosphodiesterase
VADVYDALSSRRSYKEPWDEARILEEMHALSGKSFDPEVAEAFFSCFDVLNLLPGATPIEISRQ